jgi:hypothetical protein
MFFINANLFQRHLVSASLDVYASLYYLGSLQKYIGLIFYVSKSLRNQGKCYSLPLTFLLVITMENAHVRICLKSNMTTILCLKYGDEASPCIKCPCNSNSLSLLSHNYIGRVYHVFSFFVILPKVSK